MEILDIVDEKGEPTGRTAERSLVHAQGLPHRTAHIWLVRRRPTGIEVLLQKRSMQKDSFPGCYDISSAGHIPAGQGYIESGLRELKEELGIEADPSELIFCGDFHIQNENIFHGKPFRDDQYSRVFYLWRDMEPGQFTLQKSEIDEVKWALLSDCIRENAEGALPCLWPQELAMLGRQLL